MTDSPKMVREFSRSGPCIPLGLWVRDTAKFHVFRAWLGGTNYAETETKVMRKGAAYSPAHVEACTRCDDHAKTVYPRGYSD